MVRSRQAAKKATPPARKKAAKPAGTVEGPKAVGPAVGTAEVQGKRGLALMERFNLFLAVFGAVSVVATFWTHMLLVAVLLGLSYVGVMIAAALHERSM